MHDTFLGVVTKYSKYSSILLFQNRKTQPISFVLAMFRSLNMYSTSIALYQNSYVPHIE